MAGVRPLVAILALAAFGHAELLYLGTDNFTAGVKNHTRLVVHFTHQDCLVCNSTIRHFEEATTWMKDAGVTTPVARMVVEDTNSALVNFEIQGFPTTHYYLRGEKMWVKMGSRPWMTHHGTIIEWIKKREKIVDSSHVRAWPINDAFPGLKEGETVVEARVKRNSTRQKTVWRAMEALVNYDVITPRLIVQWLPEDADPKKDARLRIHRHVFKNFDFDRRTMIYDRSWFVTDIVEWAVQLAYPSLGEEYTLHKYGESAIQETNLDASVVTILDGEETRLKVIDILRRLIPKYPKWRFTYEKWDTLKKKTKEIEFLGVEASRFEPSMFVFKGNKKFVLEGVERVRELETVTGFLSNIAIGAARPAYLSEPDPETELDRDGFLTLTGRNFPKHAFDPNKDVFVLFTSNTSKRHDGGMGLRVNDDGKDLKTAGGGPVTAVCNKCLSLEPEWKKLKKAVKEGVVLAKMEATKNRCEEEMENKELPKLILYPAAQKKKKKQIKRVVYTGPLEVAGMLDFLVENTVNELKSDEL